VLNYTDHLPSVFECTLIPACRARTRTASHAVIPSGVQTMAVLWR